MKSSMGRYTEELKRVMKDLRGRVCKFTALESAKEYDKTHGNVYAAWQVQGIPTEVAFA